MVLVEIMLFFLFSTFRCTGICVRLYGLCNSTLTNIGVIVRTVWCVNKLRNKWIVKCIVSGRTDRKLEDVHCIVFGA